MIRIGSTAPIMYGSIIVSVRISGKRSTSQMNSFDWIVTVALGSIAGSGILLSTVSITGALWAIALLLGMQWILTRSIVQYPLVAAFVKAEPTLLINNGEICGEALVRERISKQELFSALRQKGLADPSQARWVILETDATLSVIPTDHPVTTTRALDGIKHH